MDVELNKYIAERLPWKDPIGNWYDLLKIIAFHTIEEGRGTAAVNSTDTGVQMSWMNENNKTDTVLIQKEGDKIFSYINGEKDEGCTEDEVTQIFYNTVISYIVNKEKGNL